MAGKKSLRDWIIYGGGAVFIIVVLVGAGSLITDVRYIRKELSSFQEIYEKKICPPLESIPGIKGKINDEIIPNINFIRDQLKINAPNIERLQSQVSHLQKEISAKNIQMEALRAELQKAKFTSPQVAEAWEALFKEASKVQDVRGKLSTAAGALNAIQTDLRMASEKPQSLPNLQKEILQELHESQGVLANVDYDLQKTSENIEVILQRLAGPKSGVLPRHEKEKIPPLAPRLPEYEPPVIKEDKTIDKSTDKSIDKSIITPYSQPSPK
jgi:DNA repair exonuclease SbcCD ATPase subunit